MKTIDINKVLAYTPPLDFFSSFDRKCLWNEHSMDTVPLFKEMLKFLVLTTIEQASSGKRVSPPHDIDQMWHHFILYDTEAYVVFCEEHFDRVVHHKKETKKDHQSLIVLAGELGIRISGWAWGGRGFSCA